MCFISKYLKIMNDSFSEFQIIFRKVLTIVKMSVSWFSLSAVISFFLNICWMWVKTALTVKHTELFWLNVVTCLFWRNDDHSQSLNCSFGSRRRKSLVPVREVERARVQQVQALHQRPEHRPAVSQSCTESTWSLTESRRCDQLLHLASSRRAFCRYCSSAFVGSQSCSSK